MCCTQISSTDFSAVACATVLQSPLPAPLLQHCGSAAADPQIRSIPSPPSPDGALAPPFPGATFLVAWGAEEGEREAGEG